MRLEYSVWGKGLVRDDAGMLDRLWRVLKELRLYSIEEGESWRLSSRIHWTTLCAPAEQAQDWQPLSQIGTRSSLENRTEPALQPRGWHSYFCSSKYSTAESKYSSHMKRRKLYSGSNIAKLHYNKSAAWCPKQMLPHNIAWFRKTHDGI